MHVARFPMMIMAMLTLVGTAVPVDAASSRRFGC
jgi:hypothetical protein